MKGFRTQSQGSKKEQLKSLETELKNANMASRITQMMTQQLMQTVKTMSDDLGNALNQLYELQYKYTALQKHLNVPVEALDNIANEQRLVDFVEAAKKADVKDNLVEATEVAEDSTVTITSTTEQTDVDKGIFRSRLKLSECGVPELIKELQGKKVGDKVQVKLNEVQHTVELLVIRNPAPQPPEQPATH